MQHDEERHRIVAEQRQKESKAREQYNAEIRKHVTGIASSLGFALAETLKYALDSKLVPEIYQLDIKWVDLGNKICDLAEWDDAH